MTNHTVVAMFPSRNLLAKALDHITDLQDIEVLRAAIVAKASSGRTIVIDDDITADEAGVAGALLGAIIMILGAIQFGALETGFPLAVIGLLLATIAGGMLGATTGRFAKGMLATRGFVKVAREQVESLAMQVDTGRLALVLQVKNSHNVLARLSEELRRFKAEISGDFEDTVSKNADRTA